MVHSHDCKTPMTQLNFLIKIRSSNLLKKLSKNVKYFYT